MFSFALQVIFLLMFFGGIIAYLGNYVGRLIGKKRLTIFNLRPRYTATAITIISGILIALITIGILLVVSEDARTALLGLEELKNQINLKSQELSQAQNSLESARSEMQKLERAKNKLSREVEISRTGQVLLKNGDVVSISLIQSGSEKAKLEAGLKGILSAADVSLRRLGVKSKKHLIYLPPEDFDQVVYNLLGQNKTYIVKLIASRNVLWGEEIPARFELAENSLIYKSGSEITNSDIASKSLTASEIEGEIMKTLRTAHQSARDASILPDAAGSLGSIPYAQIAALAKKIKGSNKAVNLKVLAQKDIYIMGPLEVDFKVSYK